MNMIEILNNQYRKGPFYDTPNEMVEYKTVYKSLKITIFHTKPTRHGAQVMLTKKNLHFFFNKKPVDILLPFKQLFYDLYLRFTVRKETCLPFVWAHFETDDMDSYEIRVLHDQRYVSFSAQDEGSLVRKLNSELTEIFRNLSAQSAKKRSEIYAEMDKQN